MNTSRWVPRSRPAITSALLLLVAVATTACGSAGPAALAIGTEATVNHAPVEGNGFGPATTLGITVTAVRRGTVDELAAGGFEQEAAQRDMTPWYVDQRYRNAGSEAIDRHIRVSLEDAAGDLVSAATIFNDAGTEYELCPDRGQGTLQPGETFETCTLFLAEPGHEPALARFLPVEPGKETEWVSWAVKP